VLEVKGVGRSSGRFAAMKASVGKVMLSRKTRYFWSAKTV